MIKIIRFMTVFVLSFLAISFLNISFNLGYGGYLQSIILTSIFFIILFIPNARRFILIVVSFFILAMIVFYSFQQFNQADFFGSTAVGILFLTILTYLPELFRKGYIKRI